MAEGIAALPFIPSNSCSALTVKETAGKMYFPPPKKKKNTPLKISTVDGWNPANQLRLVVYPIIL